MSEGAGEVGRSILVVDDDATFRGRLVAALRSRGLEARGAGDAAEARQSAEIDSPELAVIDLRMPGGSGLELVSALHALDPTTKIVVLTGYGSIATAVDAIRRGAVNYLSKPADVDDLLAAFDRDAESPAAPPTDVPSLARVEWEHIQRVLHECGGNVSQAARLLGLHRRSLQRKLFKQPAPR